MEDSRKEIKYRCGLCTKGVGKAYSHEQHSVDCLLNYTEGYNYIQCKLCAFTGKNIACHVRKVHGYSKDDYIALHGPTLAEIARKKYSDQNKKNGDWIQRANDEGKDLTAYKQKMGKAVSEAVMSNPKERARRASLLGTLNKTEEFRKRSSETAKITSRRPEILKMRTEQLQAWRDRCPDVFYEKCTAPMIEANGKIISKGEWALFGELIKVYEGDVSQQYRLKDDRLKTKTRVRAIDLVVKRNDQLVAIEFDGPYHFEKLFEQHDFELTKAKDKNLNEVLPSLGWVLIRVGYDQYSYKDGFKKECLNEICKLIETADAGCYRIGDIYD